MTQSADFDQYLLIRSQPRELANEVRTLLLKLSLHFHGLDAGNVTVLIRDYPWDIRPGSVDMTVMLQKVETID